MTDYISTSQAIQGFLDKEKTTIEVDEFAPVVLRAALKGHDSELMVGQRCWTGYKYICPYFGPGGADNSLKALRALAYKHGWIFSMTREAWHMHNPHADPSDPDIIIRDMRKDKDSADGEALHDLLYKIATEEK